MVRFPSGSASHLLRFSPIIPFTNICGQPLSELACYAFLCAHTKPHSILPAAYYCDNVQKCMRNGTHFAVIQMFPIAN